MNPNFAGADTGPDSGNLLTPFLLKTRDTMPWPADERAFYLLTRDGLFLCRNHPFFRSSVRAKDWPSELGAHRVSLSLRHPRITRSQMERIVGLFSRVAAASGAEAAVLLIFDARRNRILLRVPRQVSRIALSRDGRRIPIQLNYETGPLLRDGFFLIGDVHSHVREAAFASATDRHDEMHRPGLHLVVGRIHWDIPEFHAEFVVDGSRFLVPFEQVCEGFEQRSARIPPAWLERIKVEVSGSGANVPPGQ